MKTLVVAFFLVAFTAVAGDIALDTNRESRVMTTNGSFVSKGDEGHEQWIFDRLRNKKAQSTISKGDEPHEKWLLERFKEAESIKVGSTYAELPKCFRGDGGPNGNGGRFRYDLVSCCCIKIDVVLADKNGKTLTTRSIFDDIPADSRVTEVSKPYLELPLSD